TRHPERTPGRRRERHRQVPRPPGPTQPPRGHHACSSTWAQPRPSGGRGGVLPMNIPRMVRRCHDGAMRRNRLSGSRYWLSYLSAGAGALLPLAGSLLLSPARPVAGFLTQLRINVGPTLLDLVLAALVLQPLVPPLNRNAVRWRNRL